MNERERLIELIGECKWWGSIAEMADYLLDNGVTVQRWIPASEPPKENGYYWCKYMASKCIGMEIWRCALLYWDDNEWLVDHKRFRRVDNVTNWMPLPEPPKEE